MRTAVVFGAGVVTGAVGLVGSAVFIPPVREAIANGLSKFASHLYNTNEEFRTKTRAFVRLLDEEGSK